jgi:hypothetical protein
LYRLIQAAAGDVDAAQRDIVYIDEIDKLRTSGTGGKDMWLGVQLVLLKMLEGTIARGVTGGRLEACDAARHPSRHNLSSSTSAAGLLCGELTRAHPPVQRMAQTLDCDLVDEPLNPTFLVIHYISLCRKK